MAVGLDGDRGEDPEADRTAKGRVMRGYVVVFEGDEETGYSAYSPDLPGVAAAAETRTEPGRLMRDAMVDHIAALREQGDPVPEPGTSTVAVVLDLSAA